MAHFQVLVCLPSRFTRGALVIVCVCVCVCVPVTGEIIMSRSSDIRHNGQQVTYDWSSPVDGPMQNIRWAAFFSDVEH